MLNAAAAITFCSARRSSLRCAVVTEFSELERLAEDWRRLCEAHPAPEVFYSLPWARASWRTYGRERRILTPVVYDDGGRIAGILPLAAEGNTLRFLSSPRSDYNDLLCDETMAGDVLETALRSLWTVPCPWTSCELDGIAESSLIARGLHGLTDGLRSRILVSHGSVCPAVDLSSGGEDVLGRILKKKSLRRHENRLERKGRVEFDHLESRQEILSHLPLFFRQHMARRALAGDQSLFAAESAKAFYRALVDELDPARELRFGVLRLDGRPIAYHLGFEAHGKFIWYKPTFDVDLWEASPGEVLLKRLFEYVGARTLKEFDFTEGSEAFKSRFANKQPRNLEVRLFASGARGRIARWRYRSRALVTRSPRVLGVLRSAAEALKSFGDALRRHGPAGLASGTIVACRRALFVRSEALLYVASNTETIPAKSGLHVRLGTLAGLACLSAEHPSIFTPARLKEARLRWKRGDELRLGLDQEACVAAAWLGNREEVADTRRSGAGHRVKLPEAGKAIEDAWVLPTRQGTDTESEFVAALGRQAREEGRKCWILWTDRDPIGCLAIEGAGFRRIVRLRAVRILGWWVPSRRQEAPSC